MDSLFEEITIDFRGLLAVEVTLLVSGAISILRFGIQYGFG